jgi:thiaminase/transcriptional activator TenA
LLREEVEIVTLLSKEFRRRSAPLWRSITAHPFVLGIGSGSISRERFEHYLKQDYVYLKEFARVLALASAKSHELSDMGYFAKLLHATLDIEMDLHRRTCAAFGIGEAALEKVPPALVTTAYANMLVRTCYEGNLSDTLAALLPCEAGYAEIAVMLKERGLPSNTHCRDWIETYSSTQFREFADWIAGKFDALAGGASARDVERWYRLYLTSTRFELLFFEMSWTLESWPRIVPE